MARGNWSIGIAAVSLLSAPAWAQTITPVVEIGDVLSGVGNVVGVIGIGVDDSGNVLAHAFTDNASAPVAIVDASHTVLLVAGQSVPLPSGATIHDFAGGVLSLSASGVPGFWLGLSGTSGGTGVDDQGLYTGFAPDLGVQRLVTACTASGVTSGSIYSSFFGPAVNDSNVMCFSGVIDDPTISDQFDTPVIAKVNVTSGAQSLVAEKDDVLPGQTQPILSFSTYVAFDNSGQTVFSAGTAAAAGFNTVIYRDGTKLAQTGDNAPWPGNPHYQNLGTSILGLGMSNNGHTVFSCQLNVPSTFGIVHDGNPFVLTGDALPSISPYRLGGLGFPLFVGDNDKVLWMGNWTPTGSALVQGLFVDYTLLVQEGVTQIGGKHVTQLSHFNPGFSMSRNGRYVVFQATLEDGTEGAYLIDLES